MELVKKITLKGHDQADIIFSYEAFVSQWHSEQMSDTYLPYYKYYDKEKGKIDMDAIPPGEKLQMGRARDGKLIDLFVKGWSREEAPSVENIKKALPGEEYNKLVKTLDAVYGDFTEEKKSPSPSNSSSDLTPTSSQTEQ